MLDFELKKDVAASLYHIGKRAFGFAEIPDATCGNQQDKAEGNREAAPVEKDGFAGDGPTEAINDADHRVNGIEQAPFFRDHAAAETYG